MLVSEGKVSNFRRVIDEVLPSYISLLLITVNPPISETIANSQSRLVPPLMTLGYSEKLDWATEAGITFDFSMALKICTSIGSKTAMRLYVL